MKQFNLGEVVDEIMPYGSIMAGDWQKDAPWKKRRRRRRNDRNLERKQKEEQNKERKEGKNDEV